MVGVADQIATGNSGAVSSTGVGFAVSVDSFKGDLAQLETGTTPVHAYLGVSAGDASDRRGGTGALVQSVQAGGPATCGGVRPGDLIVALAGARIAGVTGVVADTTRYKPGDRIPSLSSAAGGGSRSRSRWPSIRLAPSAADRADTRQRSVVRRLT